MFVEYYLKHSISNKVGGMKTSDLVRFYNNRESQAKFAKSTLREIIGESDYDFYLSKIGNRAVYALSDFKPHILSEIVAAKEYIETKHKVTVSAISGSFIHGTYREEGMDKRLREVILKVKGKDKKSDFDFIADCKDRIEDSYLGRKLDVLPGAIDRVVNF